MVAHRLLCILRVVRPKVENDHQMSHRGGEPDAARRGRFALRPWQIPWQGWKDVLWRVGDELENDDVLDVAASVAFYALLALFPALIATISLYGIVANPDDIVSQMHRLTLAIPANARSLIAQQMGEIAASSMAELRLSLLASLGVALFSASGGVAALMRGINKAYDETETRGWLRIRLLALSFTLGLAAFVVFSVAVITLLPPLMKHVGLEASARSLIEVCRWPVLAAATMLGLGILYRYAPNRTPAKWQWVSPGAVLATLIWTLASLSFSLYAANFGRFNKTYGTLGGAVVLGLWLFLSALAILLGAELNSELEQQTEKDSTIGPSRPMGERGAAAADQLGKQRPSPEPMSFRASLRERLRALNRPRRTKSRLSNR